MKTQAEILNDAIISLQIKSKQDLSLLRIQITNTKETLKPTNILKQTSVELVNFLKEEGNFFNNMLKIGMKKVGNKISIFTNRIRL